jgi:hypothetical protein
MSALEDRRPDFEIRQILKCLKTNGYELEEVEDSDEWDGNMNAIFKKNTPFSDNVGNYINDSFIKVKIMFDTRMDYTNSYRNEDKDSDEYGEYVPDIDKGKRFILNIFDTSARGGGKRKSKKNKSKGRKGKKSRRK